MYLEDIFTVQANLTGVPAISVPAGLTKSGLPYGIQFMSRPFEESLNRILGSKLRISKIKKIYTHFYVENSPLSCLLFSISFVIIVRVFY